MQSKRRDKKMPRSDVYEIYEVKICLNMNSKTDNEDRSCDDIAFLYEIIVNFRFWQVRSSTIEIPRQYPA